MYILLSIWLLFFMWPIFNKSWDRLIICTYVGIQSGSYAHMTDFRLLSFSHPQQTSPRLTVHLKQLCLQMWSLGHCPDFPALRCTAITLQIFSLWTHFQNNIWIILWVYSASFKAPLGLKKNSSFPPTKSHILKMF